MLRRSFSLFYVHRTLSGVTIKPSSPCQQKLLDTFADDHKLPHSPAVYWITAEMASKMFIKKNSSDSLSVSVSFQNVLTTEEINQVQREIFTNEVDAAQAAEEFANTMKTEISIFPLAKSDSPLLRPAHKEGKYNKKFLASTTQMILESVAAKRGYSSVCWLNAGELAASNRNHHIDKDFLAKHPPIPISFSGASSDAPEKKLFNADAVAEAAARKASIIQAVEKKLQIGNSEEFTPQEESHLLELQHPAHFTQANFNAPAAKTENALDVLCEVQRFGSGKAMPFATARELLKVKSARKFLSNKWFTTKHLVEINLHPKQGERIITVIRANGALFRCFNGDQLDSGLELREMVRLKNQTSFPMIATPEMERRARAAGIFLDSEGSDIFQEEKLEAVKAAHSKREDCTTASRQYLLQWDLTRLGYEPYPGSESASFYSQGGTKMVLFNRDDCAPVNAQTGMLLNSGEIKFDNEPKELKKARNGREELQNPAKIQKAKKNVKETQVLRASEVVSATAKNEEKKAETEKVVVAAAVKIKKVKTAKKSA